MKKRILGLLLVLCMLMSTLAVLAACGDGDETPTPTPDSGITAPADPGASILPPVGNDNTAAVVEQITPETIVTLLEDVMDAYETAPELDITELLSGIDLYANYGGAPISVKDGYISAGGAVIGFKDGCMVMVRGGEVVDYERLISNPDDEAVSEYYAMIIGMITEIAELGYLPTVTASDLYRSAEWYIFTDDYIARLFKGAAYIAYEIEMGETITEEAKAEVDAMVAQYLEMISVKFGFCAEGGTINGVYLSAKVNNFLGFIGGGATEGAPDDNIVPVPTNELIAADPPEGTASIMLTAKLTADLTNFKSFNLYADIDVPGYMDEVANLAVSYGASKLAVDFEFDMDVTAGRNGTESYEGEIEITLAHDENGIPTVLTVDADVDMDNILLNNDYDEEEFDGYYELYEFYACGNVDIDLELAVDFTKLVGSGKAIDATAKIATSGVTVTGDGYRHYYDDREDVELSYDQIKDKLSAEDKEELTNADIYNFTAVATLVTENGVGVASATVTPKKGEAMSFSLEVALNSEANVGVSEADKSLIEGFTPPAGKYDEFYATAQDLAAEGLNMTDTPEEELEENMTRGFMLTNKTGMSTLYCYEFVDPDAAEEYFDNNLALQNLGFTMIVEENVVLIGTADLISYFE